MKLLFPLLTTAFVGGAGASIYYSVKGGSNDQNKGNEEEKKLKGSKKEQEPKENQDVSEPYVPDPDKKAAPAESETVEIIDGRPVHVAERTLTFKSFFLS